MQVKIQVKTSLFVLFTLCCFSCGENYSALQITFPEDIGEVEKSKPTSLDKLFELLHDPIFHPKPCFP